MQVAEVFVNIPVKSIAKAFSYIVPDELTVGIGWRVFVPFGGRKVEGFILSVRENEQAQAGKSYQLKEIISAVDEEAWFTPEMIKAAQRRAHALEKDYSPEGLEWRIRFFQHYFRVFKCGGKPEEGFKAYSRFYQYTYVAIYRQLKEEAQKANEKEVEIEEISFEPIDFRPRLREFASPLRRAYNYLENQDLQPHDIQEVANPPKIPRTTAKFAHVKKKQ